jgi:phosphoribosyl-AMP cyclohydrolase
VYKPKYNADGLIPVIIQDYKTNKVLMLAYMNKLAFKKTIQTGKVHFYSRSRKKLWMKGEQSGHFQIVKKIYTDCDDDTLLIKVKQISGISCHTGYESCFYREMKKNKAVIIAKRIRDPKKIYV